MNKMLKKRAAADSVIEHKICGCLRGHIERGKKVLLDKKRPYIQIPYEDKFFSRTPRLKDRVLPGQKVFDQPNATDFVIHNIAPNPQISGWHTRRQAVLMVSWLCGSIYRPSLSNYVLVL